MEQQKGYPFIRFLWVILIAGAALTVLGGGIGWQLLSHSSRRNQTSAINATLEWARLAPLPSDAVNVNIQVKGGMFTRGFVVEFSASKESIAEWLSISPGTMDIQPQKTQQGDYVYGIKPGGGAQFAELILFEDGQQVRITTYWS